MQEVIINIGVSGSGKTTWSTDFMKKNPNYVRINRDDIRKTLKGDLDGYYQLKNLGVLEEIVGDIEIVMLNSALKNHFSVIVDNTNLKPRYMELYKTLVESWNMLIPAKPGKVTVRFKIFPENDAHKLKKRVNIRDIPMSWESLNYIDKQVSSLKGAIAYVEDNYKNQIINE